MMSPPSPPPPPPIPPVPPAPPIKPKDVKAAERVEEVAARKTGQRATMLTGGMGLTDQAAPTTKKTLLGG
tara:strand:+ start:524 stop:733 length:210 start_codon:yes stop_codon:yes gene_type:complete